MRVHGAPRVRADRPCSRPVIRRWRSCPPRTRGSTGLPHQRPTLERVPPAYARIDPNPAPPRSGMTRAPRVRADRPGCDEVWVKYAGCPRVRADRPGSAQERINVVECHPRTRGSTLRRRAELDDRSGAPRVPADRPAQYEGLPFEVTCPRVRADRPKPIPYQTHVDMCPPPRTRGSTDRDGGHRDRQAVPSAYARIDPCGKRWPASCCSALRVTRGSTQRSWPGRRGEVPSARTRIDPGPNGRQARSVRCPRIPAD